MVGHVSHTEIVKYYQEADVFVLTSDEYEGLPNVILESLATGTPVIATDIAGVPEAVTHNVTGILVQPRDIAGLSDAIEHLLTSNAQRTILSANGRGVVEEKFDQEKCLNQAREGLSESRLSVFATETGRPLMHALLLIVPIYVVLFFVFGMGRTKEFLLFTGIVTMPLKTTYTLMGIGAYIGWTGEIMISLSNISFLLLLPGTLFKAGAIKRSKALIVPLALFAAACLLSTMNSTWVKMSIFQVIMVVQCAVLYGLVLFNAIESKEQLCFVLLSLCISLLVQGLFGVAQFFTGKEFDFFSTGLSMGDFETLAADPTLRRVVGTVGRPNGFAEYLSPLLMIAVSLFLWGKKSKALIGIACSFGILALLFSFSRGGWIGFLSGFLVLMVFLSRKGIISTSKVTLTCAAMFALTLIFLPQVLERLFGGDANAAGSRLPLIRIAFNMITEHPIIGIGINTFRSVMRSYMSGLDQSQVYLYAVHNQYLLVLAEAGILGLASFLWLMYCFFRESVRCLRCTDTTFQLLGAAALAGYTAMSTHMLVDMYSSPLCLGSMFAFFAICAAANRIGGSSDEPSELSTTA